MAEEAPDIQTIETQTTDAGEPDVTIDTPETQPNTEQEASDNSGVSADLEDAARAANWTDDEIREHVKAVGPARAAADFGRYRDRFASFAQPQNTLNPQIQTPQPNRQEPEVKPEAQPLDFKAELAAIEQVYPEAKPHLEAMFAKMSKALDERVGQFTEAQKVAQAQAQQQAAAAEEKAVHAMFDEMGAKSYPFFGKSDSLTRGALEARREAYQLALSIKQHNPQMDGQQAIRAAVSVIAKQRAGNTEQRAEQITKRSATRTIPPSSGGRGGGGGAEAGSWDKFAKSLGEKLNA